MKDQTLYYVLSMLKKVSENKIRKVFGYAHEAGKGIIIVVNKWDTVEKETNTLRDFELEVREEFRYLSYAPIIFVSATTKKRLDKLPDIIEQVHNNQNIRIQSSILNDVVMDAVATNPTPTDKGKRLKIFLYDSSKCKPSYIYHFRNDPELLHFSYKRFLENRFRATFNFEGTPIHIIARRRT